MTPTDPSADNPDPGNPGLTRQRVSEAAATGHAVTDGAWPDMEQSRRLLRDYCEQHEVGEAGELPEDTTPGEED
jgi:hypothetical protein